MKTFKEYVTEKKLKYELGDWVVLKKSGYDKLKKENPKENVKLYKKFHIEKIEYYGDIYITSSFLDDPDVKLGVVKGKIREEDIERKYDWKLKK